MNNTVKTKNKFYEQWWFWLLVLSPFILLGLIVSFIPEADDNTITTGSTNNTITREELPEVKVIDFDEMPKDLVENWFEVSKVNGSIVEEYSDTVKKGSIISQSVEPQTIIHEGDKIVVTYSLGKEPSTGEKNALREAKDYLKNMPFSYKGLIEQLEYEGYSKKEATYGADNCEANWKEQAGKMAKQYIKTSSFSRIGLIEQLEYEGFTKSQAEYGVKQAGY